MSNIIEVAFASELAERKEVLKVITFKDGDETKTVQCFTQDQVDRIEGYLKLRAQFEKECKEELDAIDKRWETQKANLAKRYSVHFNKVNK